jgi:hypothetical protein
MLFVDTGKSFYRFITLYQDFVMLTIIICIVVIGSANRMSTLKIVTAFQEKIYKYENTKSKILNCNANVFFKQVSKYRYHPQICKYEYSKRVSSWSIH